MSCKTKGERLIMCSLSDERPVRLFFFSKNSHFIDKNLKICYTGLSYLKTQISLDFHAFAAKFRKKLPSLVFAG